ncbi:hypothetical protein HG535_0G02070 [Zygotorulaspora mrakii]|uniref:Protein-serine/threonine kinase n=1 Tax=Zygotorulaspora mrakii TaxID=42260 RepID=A0A7H9B743_ZYGMR|nr:uncharacterized protein HG535_0G02070 [Zygotorulaspora mrakii]QLG74323.1 hypothetical protein HG535_0G02070 [Zygotorulaspora mrakii]
MSYNRLNNGLIRFKHSVHTPNISQIPNFTKYCPIRPINEELAPYVHETMNAYPRGSKHVNQQHYYHNRTVLLHDYLRKKPHAMSLLQLAQYYDDSAKLTKQKIINSGKFVKEELAIRMAHKIFMLQQLPFSVINNFHFVQVYESYYNIFERFRKFPAIRTLDDNYRFAEFLKSILQDFNSLNLPHLVMGALECTILDLYPQDKMDELLSGLLRARISRRLIVEEHISVTANFLSGKEENTLVLGDIFQECSATEYILDASRACQKFIQEMYFESLPLPELIINGDTDLKFYFLPIHLKYLLGEILRNSYEATIKDYIRQGLKKPQPIVVTIIKNEESSLFRISDRAGGVPHNDKNIWSFGKSKERASESLKNFHMLPGLQTVSLYDHLYHNKRASTESANRPYMYTSLEPMSHTNLTTGKIQFVKPLVRFIERSYRYRLGIGLAMCKVYAEYWNGDLTSHSIQGYGTDTVLKLGNLMNSNRKLQLDKV